MACVSVPPEVNTLRIKLNQIRHIDAEEINWSSDQVDSVFSKLASTVKIFPNKRQLKKKTFRENNVTFHDGQPVSVVPGGSNVSESFIVLHNMCEESERFLTYFHYKWPSNAPVSPSVLAKAGFYYFGVTDTVQCFSCNGRINNWDPGDTAMGEHRRLYPKCKFVQGIDNRNIPSRGLLDGSLKGTSSKQSPKSEGPSSSSSEDEAGCSDISKLLKPLTPEESKPTDETQSYFQKELNRLMSFKTWPMASPVDRFDLAAAGFYCVNESNGTVQCFACFGRLSDWKLGDVPRLEHQRLFPSCPFIVGIDTGNVPLTAYDKDKTVKFFAEHSSYLRQPLQISSNLSQSERLAGQSSSSQRSPVNPLLAAAELPLSTDMTVKYAKYSKYAYEQARLETYGGWPRNHSQIPANLARAGFFATGNGDQVICFYCGGGLKDWSIGDDPWEEHARWFTRCEWLLQQRGPAFVDSTSRKYGPVDHSYFDLNMGIFSDRNATLQPTSPPEPHPAPQEAISASATAEPERRPAEQRKKKVESKQGVGKQQHEKKKHERKNEPLSERVEDLFKSDIAQLMVDVGQDETIIRNVLRKRLESGQSPFQTSEELLEAIFEEEENQQRGAINNEPAEVPASPKRQPKKTAAVKEPEKQTSHNQRQKSPGKEWMEPLEGVEDLFKSDIAQFMVDMGQDETIIRNVLRKRLESGQSPFQTSEELLEAIFEEEENQQRGAINNEPAEVPASPKRQPKKTAAVKEPEKQTSHNQRQKSPGKERMEPLEDSRQRILCKICKQLREVVFLPCRHMVTCKKCSETLDRCIVKECGQIIRDRIDGILCENSLQRILCKICKHLREVVFLPCRHMVTCEKCSETLDRCIVKECGQIIRDKIDGILCENPSNHS